MNVAGVGALFGRALRIESRTWRSHGLRCALGAVLLLMVWQQAEISWRGAAGAALLGTVAWTGVVFFTLFGFSHFASAITEEKEEGTLGLMRLAGLPPPSILLGKGAARLFDALILAACALPFAVLAVTLGGVTLAQVLACAIAVAAHAVLLCGLGLLCSTVGATLQHASGMLTILHLVLFLAPAWLWAGLRGVEGWTWLSETARIMTGWGVFSRLSEILATGWNGSVISGQAFASVIGGILAFFVAWGLFDRFAKDGEPAAGTPLRSRMRWKRILSLPRAPTGLQAIAWKDFHLTCGGRWVLIAKFLVIALIAAIIALLWWPTSEWAWRDLSIWTFAIGVCWLVVEVAAILARLYAVEVRDRTLDGLLLLPVTTGGLVWRKLAALPRALIPALTLMVVGAAGGLDKIFDGLVKALDEPGFWTVVATVLYFWSLCAYLSLRVKRAPLVMAILTVMVTWFLVSMLGGILGLFRGSSDGFLIVVIAIYLLASWGMWMAIPGQLRRHGER